MKYSSVYKSFSFSDVPLSAGNFEMPIIHIAWLRVYL